MADWDRDYGKPDLIRVSQKIYQNKEKRKELELQLSQEKFKYRYVFIQKDLVIHEALQKGVLILVLGFLLPFLLEEGFWIFLGLLLLVGEGILICQEVVLLYRLFISRNTEGAMEFAKKHNLDTFQRKQRETEEAIRMLERQISELSAENESLQQQRNAMFKEQEKGEQILRERGILFDENPNKKEDGLSLKETDLFYGDICEINEYFVKEEQYIREGLLQAEGELEHLSRDMVQVDEAFLAVKHKLILCLIVFAFLIVIQSLFQGTLGAVTGILCFGIMLGYLIYLDKVCKTPFLRYLIEHDSKWTRDYAFCNNIVPLKERRKVLQEKKTQWEEELTDLKKRKKKWEEAMGIQ